MKNGVIQGTRMVVQQLLHMPKQLKGAAVSKFLLRKQLLQMGKAGRCCPLKKGLFQLIKRCSDRWICKDVIDFFAAAGLRAEIT